VLRTEKQKEVESLKECFLKAKATFFTDYKGLTANQVNDLRKQLRSLDVEVRVAKNNLVRTAVREASFGENVNKFVEAVVGPTMIAFTYGDPAKVAKVIKKFSEENEVFNFKESLLGVQVLSTQQIEELSKLPGREVLIAKMLGSLNAPVTNFVGVLAAVPRSFVQVLAAIAEKKKT